MTTITKVIILEGPDGSGKSTLAARLRDQHGYQIVKFGPPRPREDMLVTYTNSLLTAIASKRPTVIDRHYLGESVYGPLLRGEDRLGAQGRDLIERLIAARGVRLIICSPPWKTLVKAWKAKDDLLKRVDQLCHVRAAYLAEAKRLHLVVYDWTQGQPPSLETTPTLPEGVTGYQEADTLWVGERPGKKHVKWDLPFHDTTNSARYLWESLQGVRGWRERRGAWTNAWDAEGEPRDLFGIVSALPKVTRVIPLGDAATDVCNHMRLDLVWQIMPMPHPQYWRRFHHHDQKGYTALLEAALR